MTGAYEMIHSVPVAANRHIIKKEQETRMLSQALNRAMLHSRNQLEEVNRKKLIFYLAVQLYCTLKQ